MFLLVAVTKLLKHFSGNGAVYFVLLFLWFFSDCPRKPKVFMMKLTLWLIFECQRKTTLTFFFYMVTVYCYSYTLLFLWLVK